MVATIDISKFKFTDNDIKFTNIDFWRLLILPFSVNKKIIISKRKSHYQ